MGGSKGGSTFYAPKDWLLPDLRVKLRRVEKQDDRLCPKEGGGLVYTSVTGCVRFLDEHPI